MYNYNDNRNRSITNVLNTLDILTYYSFHIIIFNNN